MKHDSPAKAECSRRRTPLALLILPILALALTACGHIAPPKGWASPIENNGIIYASLEAGKISAVDARTGQRNWTYPTDDKETLQGVYGTPILQSNILYVAGYNGAIVALNTADGSARWRTTITGPIIGNMAANSNTLYIPSATGMLHTINTGDGSATGSPINIGSPLWSAPALSGTTAYITTMDGHLAAVNLNERTIAWTIESPNSQPATPEVLNNRLIYGGMDKVMQSLDTSTRQQVWSSTGTNWFWMQPLVSGQNVYFADLDGNVFAVNADNGQSIWSAPFKAETAVKARPIIANNTLIIVDRSGHIYGLNPQTGQPNWNMQSLNQGVLADPSQSGDTVLILQENGALVRLNAASGAVAVIGQQ